MMKPMTIRSLQWAIQSAIDEHGIPDDSEVSVLGGNIYAVKNDEWHKLGPVKKSLLNAPTKGILAIPSYTLKELEQKDIDFWVEALSEMISVRNIREEACAMEGVDASDSSVCPAELYNAMYKLADRYQFRFDEYGRILSYNML